MEATIMATISPRDPGTSIDRYITQLAGLHEEGFRRVWVSQMPGEPDALTVLAVAGREVPDLQFGTSVLPIQPQHPMGLAQRALTTDAIIGGRLTLGLGLTHQVVSEGMWGIPYNRQIRRASEYLDGLLPLLNGEMADAGGEIYTTRGAFTMTDVPHPPVYLAALGPKMLKLAGSRTSGTITWMTGPQTLAGHIVPSLRAAAVDAGRDADSVKVVAMLPVAVTDDVDTARTAAGKAFRRYNDLPSYRAMLDREGYAKAEDAAIIGDEHAVAEQLAALASIGVDEFVGIPFSRDEDVAARTRALLRTVDGGA
ncbi:MAG: TIGR03564 family F420-dependent LLM class oxidoreductase [Gordonia sp. (in: high G+C Gram-positive bacteria)]